MKLWGSRRERSSLTDSFSYRKWNKQTLFTFMTEQTNWPQRTTQFHTVLLCLYVADPATCLASNCVLATWISSESSSFIHSWKNNKYFCLYYYLNNKVNISILSLNFFTKTTQCPFNASVSMHVFEDIMCLPLCVVPPPGQKSTMSGTLLFSDSF